MPSKYTKYSSKRRPAPKKSGGSQKRPDPDPSNPGALLSPPLPRSRPLPDPEPAKATGTHADEDIADPDAANGIPNIVRDIPFAICLTAGIFASIVGLAYALDVGYTYCFLTPAQRANNPRAIQVEKLSRALEELVRPAREAVTPTIPHEKFLGAVKTIIHASPWLQYCMNAVTYYRELFEWGVSHVRGADMFLVQSVVTCGAFFWLLHRAWQVLWKPVPELISILGIEVPDPPAVTLTGIKSESISLAWTRPDGNKPVVRYLIQVNGVNVGESSRTETAITVTGLKPAHFYNVRVIAVGSNNFQAGSRVLRVRCYNKDGTPTNDCGFPSRHPDSDNDDDDDNDDEDSGDSDTPSVHDPSAGIERTISSENPSAIPREHAAGQGSQGQRRNTGSGHTGGRRHSPSAASADQPNLPLLPNVASSNFPGESMQQLTERFQAIRTEQDETAAQGQRDTQEFKSQLSELLKEKEDRKQTLNQKEDASEKLRKESQISERLNREAQQRRSKKEKVLRGKSAEGRKMKEDMTRWAKEIEDMEKARDAERAEMVTLNDARERDCNALQSDIRKRAEDLNRLEEEIRVRGLQIKELEEDRQKIHGGLDDDASRDRDGAERFDDLDWDEKDKDYWKQRNEQALQLEALQVDYFQAEAKLAAIATLQSSPFVYAGNSSVPDFDPSGVQGRAKPRRSRNRKSRASTISSPSPEYPMGDTSFPSSTTYNNPTGFAPGPYFDMSGTVSNDNHLTVHGMSEVDIQALTAGAPLSPGATSLLPSTLFIDDDLHDEPNGVFGPALHSNGSPENELPSPVSSSRPTSQMSSPQPSTYNMSTVAGHGREYSVDNERQIMASPLQDFGAIGSPRSPAASEHAASRKSLKSYFTRIKSSQEPPTLGSLKQGQSHSFPRPTDEIEVVKQRRTSFSSGWTGIPNLFGRSLTVGATPSGNAPVPARQDSHRRRRGFQPFNSSVDEPGFPYSERDPSSPRPVSIASSDLPRPSTDSAPFGWPAADGGMINGNSPLAANWSASVNVTQTWSRNPSRRPSFQHSTPGIVSEDEDFLPRIPYTAQSSPLSAGVVGSRPPSGANPVTPKLNPAAPTFSFLNPFPKKAKSADTSISVSNENGSPPSGNPRSADSNKFRGTPSVHTQNSIADSVESLDRIESTISEVTNASNKDTESSYKKLLRKGSSSRFSLTSGISIFGGKKRTGSVATSDRNISGDREGSIDFSEDATTNSVTSSPKIGSYDGSKDDRKGAIAKQSRNWGRAFGIKKGKGRGSLEVDRSEAETTGPEDEGDAVV